MVKIKWWQSMVEKSAPDCQQEGKGHWQQTPKFKNRCCRFTEKCFFQYSFCARKSNPYPIPSDMLRTKTKELNHIANLWPTCLLAYSSCSKQLLVSSPFGNLYKVVTAFCSSFGPAVLLRQAVRYNKGRIISEASTIRPQMGRDW